MPPAEDLIKISEYFKISIDSLIKIDLSKLGGLKLRELEAGNDIYMTGTNIRVLAITVDNNNKENMEFVPVKAKAGYRAGYNDPQFIAALPKFSMPNLPAGSFRMFPTVGDSMLPIPENSEIITKYIENWTTLKPDTLCIVILKGEQDFVFKQVTIQDEGNILLKSLNPVYSPYSVASEDVLEIWEYYKYQSATLPDLPTDLQEVKRLILDVKDELHKNQKPD